MHHVKVGDDFVKNLFENKSWKSFGLDVAVEEAEAEENEEKAEEVNEGKKEEVNEETEEYACPLCEDRDWETLPRLILE